MAIGNAIPVFVDDIAGVLTDGWTGINIWRASSQNGTYTKLVDVGVLPITLVAGTGAYSYQDTAGSDTSWYKTSLWNGIADGTLSAAQPATNAPLVTRGTLRQQVAYELDCLGLPNREYTFPLELATTADGTATTVVCASYQGALWSSLDFIGAFVLATSGGQAGAWRQVTAGIDGTTGTLTVDAFTDALMTGSTFEVYKRATPEQWNDWLNEQLLDQWTPFRWPFAGIAAQTEYGLPYWIEDASQVARLTQVQGTTTSQHRFTSGRDYLLQPLEGGGAILYFDSAQIAANQIAILQGYRHPAKLFSDTDTLTLSESQERILVIGAAQKAAEWIAGAASAGEDRQVWRQKATRLEDRRRVLLRENPVWSTTPPVRPGPMVGVGSGGPPISSGFSQHYR